MKTSDIKLPEITRRLIKVAIALDEAAKAMQASRHLATIEEAHEALAGHIDSVVREAWNLAGDEMLYRIDRKALLSK